jgi:hypothetical protein
MLFNKITIGFNLLRINKFELFRLREKTLI